MGARKETYWKVVTEEGGGKVRENGGHTVVTWFTAVDLVTVGVIVAVIQLVLMPLLQAAAY